MFPMALFASHSWPEPEELEKISAAISKVTKLLSTQQFKIHTLDLSSSEYKDVVLISTDDPQIIILILPVENNVTFYECRSEEKSKTESIRKFPEKLHIAEKGR